MPSQARADTRTPVRVGDVRSARRTFRTAPGVASGGLSVRRDCRPREGWRASVGLPSARRRASVAVRTAFPMGARSQRDRSDAARQRGSPSRHGTGERRAYVHCTRGVSPFDGAIGRFDATSARRRQSTECLVTLSLSSEYYFGTRQESLSAISIFSSSTNPNQSAR